MTVLQIALTQYFNKEIVGEQDNPEVVKYFKEIGHTEVNNDETAWCSAFVNWCCMKAGLPYTKALNARSWLKIGVKAEEPMPGDIVVLWRGDPNGWQGHVGFFVRYLGDNILILGGNQSNMVNISAYPKTQILDIRKL